MLKAAELRLRLHDLVCMSGCGQIPAEWPDDVTEKFRQEYTSRSTQQRVEHARTMAQPAKAFRTPGADRLQVLHDAVCANGPGCTQGVDHLPARVRNLATEWDAARG